VSEQEPVEEASDAGAEPSAPAGPIVETRFRRGLRYGHRGGLYASLVVGIGVVVLLILLIARNTRAVKLDYIFGSTQARLIWLIVISAIGGWVLGIVTSFLVRQRTRRPR
jgi:uncharacterized integral membrane protein